MASRDRTRLRVTLGEQPWQPSKGTMKAARQQKQIMIETQATLRQSNHSLLRRVQLLEKQAFAALMVSRLRYEDD